MAVSIKQATNMNHLIKLSPNVILRRDSIAGFITASERTANGWLPTDRTDVRVLVEGCGATWLESCKTEKLAQKRCEQLAREHEKWLRERERKG